MPARHTGLFRSVLLFVLLWGSEPRVFATRGDDAQNIKISFKINEFMRVASDRVKGFENAKSAILSPVRLPFRHSGRRSPGEGGSDSRDDCRKIARCAQGSLSDA